MTVKMTLAGRFKTKVRIVLLRFCLPLLAIQGRDDSKCFT